MKNPERHLHSPSSAGSAADRGLGSALLGAAVGDALGWPNEPNNQRLGHSRSGQKAAPSGRFDEWERRVGGRFWASREPVRAGEYSDDTQLLIATTRSLTRGVDGWFDWFARGELPAWLTYERGGGRATKAAAQAWAKRKAPWEQTARQDVERYFNAGGNGAAMRVLPHALTAGSMEQIRREVLANSIATHGHPRALLGALLYAAGLAIARQKTGSWQLGELLESVSAARWAWAEPPSSAEVPLSWVKASALVSLNRDFGSWPQAVQEVEEALRVASGAVRRGALASDDSVLTEIGAKGSKIGGAGTISAVAALFLASRYAADPATALRVAAYEEEIDTDTIASMTGGLLGTMLGEAWIPAEWRHVQDADFLIQLAADAQGAPRRKQGTVDFERMVGTAYWTESESKHLREDMMEHAHSSANLGPLGALRIEAVEELQPIVARARMTRWRLRTSEGQSVFLASAARAADETDSMRRRTVRHEPEQLSLTGDPPDVGAHTDARRQASEGARRARILSELDALTRELPPTLSAAQLAALLHELIVVMAELDFKRQPGSDSEAIAEVVSSLAAGLVDRGLPRIDRGTLVRAARVAWRLAHSGESKSSDSARSG